MEELRVRLETLLQSGGRQLETVASQRILIYGAGECGQKVAALAKANGIEVVAFIDARSNGRVGEDGLRRLSPDSAEVRQLAREVLPVVVGIFNFATDLRPVVSLLRNLGFKQIVSYPDFHEQYGKSDDFWLTKRENYSKWRDAILAGFEVFADEESRSNYYEILAHRLNLDFRSLNEPDTANHYFPHDLPAPIEPMRLVDGGAFDGDTLRLIAEKELRLSAVAAFEPDLFNYTALCRSAAELGGRLGETTLVPCGLGERTEMLSFRPGGGSGSSIDAKGTTHIQVVALDDILPNFAPTFLKLDIEGAEAAALRGAARMISRYKPRLAVCVYHQPEHLWTLPQLIHQLNPGYKLALRYHQWNGFDVVAYAY